MGRVLDHNDTVVSATQVSGRGMKRSEAAKVHKWVSEQMNKVFPPANDAALHHGAGIMMVSPANRALFLRRKHGDHEGEWDFPGGGRDGGESAEETAKR